MNRASLPLRRWLVCYDIGTPRVRRRVARLLEGEGLRLQRSVFLVEASPDQIERLRRRCQALVRAGDRLLVEAAGAELPVPWKRRAPAGLPRYWLA